MNKLKLLFNNPTGMFCDLKKGSRCSKLKKAVFEREKAKMNNLPQ